ncbi:hypothetical protein ACJJTC_011709 [Scirpophaga incertulas]
MASDARASPEQQQPVGAINKRGTLSGTCWYRSGALLYWEYRASPLGEPLAAEWGGPAADAADVADAADAGQTDGRRPPRPPRLVAALAALHARYGALPWPRLLQPAARVAREGFLVSEGLAAVEGGPAGEHRTALPLAEYLETLQANTSAGIIDPIA